VIELTALACQDQFDTKGATMATINSARLLGMEV
jgi:hypothetical protein